MVRYKFKQKIGMLSNMLGAHREGRNLGYKTMWSHPHPVVVYVMCVAIYIYDYIYIYTHKHTHIPKGPLSLFPTGILRGLWSQLLVLWACYLRAICSPLLRAAVNVPLSRSLDSPWMDVQYLGELNLPWKVATAIQLSILIIIRISIGAIICSGGI